MTGEKRTETRMIPYISQPPPLALPACIMYGMIDCREGHGVKIGNTQC